MPDRGGAVRHAAQGVVIELGLGQRQPAVLLDRPDADRSIAPDTRQHDADGALAAILGQRCEERIDGPAMLAQRRRRLEPENAIHDGERRIRRDDEHTVRFDRKPIRGGHHRNRALRSEQLDQQALVVRGEVLHQHERHAGVGRQVRQKALEGGQTSGRGADADDEGWACDFGAGHDRCLPAVQYGISRSIANPCCINICSSDGTGARQPSLPTFDPHNSIMDRSTRVISWRIAWTASFTSSASWSSSW